MFQNRNIILNKSKETKWESKLIGFPFGFFAFLLFFYHRKTYFYLTAACSFIRGNIHFHI